MGRPKKEEAVAMEKSGFKQRISDLKKELEIINVCNELIEAENPFSIEIKNKSLFKQLSKEFKIILETKFLNKEEESAKEEKMGLSEQDIVIFKQYVERIKDKIGSGKFEEKKENFIIDFNEGDYIRLRKSSILRAKKNGTFLLPIGTELLVVKKINEHKIQVLNSDNGVEGVINSSDVEKR